MEEDKKRAKKKKGSDTKSASKREIMVRVNTRKVAWGMLIFPAAMGRSFLWGV